MSSTPDRVASQERVERVAALLVAARRARRPLPELPAEWRLASNAEGYAVQARVMELLGTRPAAWKAATPGGPIGNTATRAPIFAELLVPSGAHLAAADHPMLVIEAEIGWRLGHDLPARSAPYSLEEVRDAIAMACAAIEVADSRLANFYEAPLPDRLADNVGNGAVVAGSGTPDWRAIDFGQVEVTLAIDDVVRVARTGSHPTGDPLAPLAWLANHLGAPGGPGLQAGQLVITGSWTGMTRAAPGNAICVRFAGIGEARVQFD